MVFAKDGELAGFVKRLDEFQSHQQEVVNIA
jgi:hypothetical protein